YGDMVEDEEGVRGDDMRVGVEEEVLDPAEVAVGANSVAAVAERVVRRGSHMHVFKRRLMRVVEEVKGMVFEVGDEVKWNPMVDELEEAIVIAGLDHYGLGLRVGEIHLRSAGKDGWSSLAWFDWE
ncbi:hypothetical protein PIB30_105693, partial [Stylosanthes scabra]|nr:hypothetical protein [Stylosanthes scabra]